MSSTSSSCVSSVDLQYGHSSGSSRATTVLPQCCAVPGGDAMPPPELAADAPVADVRQPVLVGVLPALGVEPHIAVPPGLEGLLGQGLHLHEPLLGEVGLHHGMAAVAVAHRVAYWFLPHEETERRQVLHHGLAGFLDREAAVLGRRGVGQRAVGVEDVDALGRLWRLPISKSLGSWAGVIFTRPVPNSRST